MALTKKLTDIAEAIRIKTGKSDLLTLEQMAVEIAAIETGGGSLELPEEAYKISGKCDYMFSEGKWKWFIDMFGNKITTENITTAVQMFIRAKLEAIPFDFNLAKNCSDLAYLFYDNKIKEAPLIKGELNIPTGNWSGTINLSNMFGACDYLREIPYDYFRNFGGDAYWEAHKKYKANRSSMFPNCYSLRQLPDLSMLKVTDTSAYDSLYYGLITRCFALDEATNIPVLDTCTYTSNAFRDMVNQCERLKELTFETNEDGTSITVNWSNQTIDLSNSVGYCNGYAGETTIINYNSGITIDKYVTDATSYAALKNDPDWYGTKAYSRYNHDSAVNTINSLPTTTGTGCTIKFLGVSGEKTDGGAINTLTEAEIAVAAAKGWTVTLV